MVGGKADGSWAYGVVPSHPQIMKRMKEYDDDNDDDTTDHDKSAKGQRAAIASANGRDAVGGCAGPSSNGLHHCNIRCT